MTVKTRKPTIVIGLTSPELEKHISSLLYGMEEEGIPYEISYFENCLMGENAATLASLHSQLGVGIGVDNEKICLHTKNLKENKDYLTLNNYLSVSEQEIKKFGSNSARIVKIIPLKE